MDLGKILRAPRNPKQHDLGQLSASIERFGFVAPLLLNEQTGRLVAGGGRLDALQARKAAGLPPPARVRAVGDRWEVPVLRGMAFSSEAEAEAYLVADNRLVELGGWDEEGLARLLADLSATSGEALTGIGYDRDDLDVLLASLRGPGLGRELDETEADGVTVCICATCGHEHHKTVKE